ncbi:MAG: Crp/Fnr family transcriptional regulator [Cytophagales bacterium]|nr:Crp/Fnr family transcriptional regulator [Cytophagales bacterium]
MSPHTHLLQTLRAIRPLSDEDWEMAASKFKPVTYQKKQRIIDTETVANSYVFISKGLARLHGYKDGEEKTLFFFKEGMFAGSIQSYLFEKPSLLVLETIEEIEGLEISKEDLEAIFQQSPDLSFIIMTYTQLRLNHLLHFFSSFVLDSPEERYEKFMANEPDLLNRVPQHIIASFLGMTPVSLSRIRKRLLERR